MKDLKLFVLENCPYCKSCLKDIKELQEEDASLRDVKIHIIEERKEKELADSYDYYLVPSFFLDEMKVHEGAIKKEQVRHILQSAL